MKPVVIPAGYGVTRDGRVFSMRAGNRRKGGCVELRQHINGSGFGYPSVWLWKSSTSRKHIAVYRLVAAVHLPPRPSAKHYVCHKDGDRMNNHANNLYWGTAKENAYDAWKHRRAVQVKPTAESRVEF